MKIGIVSAPKHCKTHIRSLRKEGYNIHCLGDDPKGIPSSYDVVVVRVASSSHQGVAVAREWSRKTGKPSLYENGLSGIRSALQDLSPTPKSEGGASPSTMTLETARSLVRQWGETLYESRPHETRDTMQRHLKATLRREHPNQYSLWAPLIPAICVDLIAVETAGALMGGSAGTKISVPVVEEPVVEEPLAVEKDNSMSVYPTENSPAPWGRVYTPVKLRRAVEAARALMDELGEDLVGAFRQAYLRCEANPSTELWKWMCREPSYLKRGAKRTVFCGKPVVYVAFVYLLFMDSPDRPRRLKRTFYTSYKSVTAKGADTRIPDALAWYLGFPPPEESVVYHKAMKSRAQKKAASPKATSPKEVGGGATLSTPLTARMVADLDEHTRTLFTLMDEVKTLREQHTTEMGALRSEVESLRGQKSVGPALSDPFAALEEIKLRLATLGFKGSLTLTVE